MKKALIITAAVVALLTMLFVNRWWVVLNVMALAGVPPLAIAREEPGAYWFDDYYTVFRIDERTFAIGETRYWQKNFNYLIVGDERALLFDAGPGVRDIRPVVESLTELPFVFTPSHFHYDHVGNGVVFEEVGMIDLPYLRHRALDDRLTLTRWEHIGEGERFEEWTLQIDEWWAPGSTIDLGGRTIIAVHTPGHTLNSLSLVDADSNYAFTGDFFGPGSLLEMVPTSGMGDYLHGVENLLEHVDESTRLFAAHRNLLAEPEPRGVPETSYDDLDDARTTLVGIRDGDLTGSGVFPVVYTINQNVELWANPAWLQDWERSPVD